jgi:NAD(P)-dependent dehydrogenase (short-subunit alcohol dehydrogenase family)
MGMVEGKVAVVTGAASGIGRATAVLLAAEGAAVVATDRDQGRLGQTVDQIAGAGGRALALTVDVTHPDQIEAMTALAVSRFGRLDCAVNCAGYFAVSGPAGEMSDDVWNDTLAINLTGLVRCMKAEISAMAPAGGAIVNISSGAGLMGVLGSIGYVASKHGVIGATKTAALDYARQGIRVNAICPGLVATPMTQAGIDQGLMDIAHICPMGRPARPEEIAEAALWLCSDRSSYVSGTALLVDGATQAGMRMA